MADHDAETSTTLSAGGRKRQLSDVSDTEQFSTPVSERKRLRRTISVSLSGALLGPMPVIHPDPNNDRLPKPHRSILDEEFKALTSVPAIRPLSSSSSFTEGSRNASPSPFVVPSSYVKPELARSASFSSLRSTPATNYPDISSFHNLRDAKTTIDFSVPPSTNDSDTLLPLTSSSKSVVYFTRGNRVHYKNLQTNEDIGQLFKLQDKYGDLKLMECGGPDNSDTLAIATSKGTIQLWDVRVKKMTASWSTKGVGAMQFNGPVLTVGGVKGSLKFYDTRIAPTSTSKMKSEARKLTRQLTRHQSYITTLAWNETGKLLATGDDSGSVYCWDNREKVPLDVGEFVQRRKKIQHSVSVTVVNWCPWQPKLLGTGDANGTLRLWDVDTSDSKSNALNPGKLELGSRINGLHFSPYCKEMITVHGARPANLDTSRTTHSTSNSIVAHSFPTLRHIHTLLAADKVIGGSVMNANFTKAIIAVPEENKLKVYDVWGKYRDLRRSSSFMGIR
ncbi:WD40-repeat-containing domain protein [Rhodocollybia butyracea]|uniref:WD40-repeat-containing domain protein n=1 Tax=Rhodocollybia butyracea TaxID=206335 RepID=A0A9P5Q4B4_9AGAR|nr:WD40-repeat-containing domain protein [Rhodocollybia butyracea]